MPSAFILPGCNGSPATISAGPSIESGAYWLTTEPPNPQAVKAAREFSKDNDEVVVVGRILSYACC
jgi:hypothetical protein